MGRYLLFAGERYYPAGGFNDFAGSFDDPDEADLAGQGHDWHHVVDRATWRDATGHLGFEGQDRLAEAAPREDDC